MFPSKRTEKWNIFPTEAEIDFFSFRLKNSFEFHNVFSDRHENVWRILWIWVLYFLCERLEGFVGGWGVRGYQMDGLRRVLSVVFMFVSRSFIASIMSVLLFEVWWAPLSPDWIILVYFNDVVSEHVLSLTLALHKSQTIMYNWKALTNHQCLKAINFNHHQYNWKLADDCLKLNGSKIGSSRCEL